MNKIEAEASKSRGNFFFGEFKYSEAIREYSVAIVKFPQSASYFTNRALCYIRLCEFAAAIQDCRKSIELDSKWVKGYYFLGQALLGVGSMVHIQEAIRVLTTALHLAIKLRTLPYTSDIAQWCLTAKKDRWVIIDQERRKSNSNMYKYISELIEKEQPTDTNSFISRDKLQIQLNNFLENSNIDTRQRPHIPDYMIDKITFNIMVHPVIAPSGISYDKHVILEHLFKVGNFDPFTREPLNPDDLVPNLALKGKY